jgi:RHS repeat-associated protein
VAHIHGPNADQPLAMELYAPNATPTPRAASACSPTHFCGSRAGSENRRPLFRARSGAQVVNRYEYDSYGKRLSVVEGVSQPYTWKAREFISGLDMYYNRARFYDPQMGRFTSEDPLRIDGGDTNIYRFGSDNPKSWNDPTGLSLIENSIILAKRTAIGAAGGAIGGAIACVLMIPSDALGKAVKTFNAG